MPTPPKGRVDELGRECAKCGDYKLWEYYAKHTRSLTGHQTRCKDCMRPMLADSSARRRERHRKVIQAAKDRPCADCGVRYPPFVMEFDHLPEHEKVGNISMLGSFTDEGLLAEIAKCEVVCSNCHRIRTHDRGQHLTRGAR